MEIKRINNYVFNKPLVSENSGFSKWGIGYRGGNKYFVKEFLSPVYPVEDSVFSEKKKQDRIKLCNRFVESKKNMYQALREANDGHIVTVEQFFRVGAKYYMSTKVIDGQLVSISDISKCSFEERVRLCCEIAHSMAAVHDKKIVHADIKPDNIMIVRKESLQANIIDFDCSFFEYNSPKLGEELNGDLVYLSPEGFLHIIESESNLSCKIDVFALGLLFHQYFTGKLPSFDNSEYQYAYESVLDDHPLGICGIENEECYHLLEKMVEKDPDDRPDMQTVFETLKKIITEENEPNVPEEKKSDSQGNEFFFVPAEDFL